MNEMPDWVKTGLLIAGLVGGSNAAQWLGVTAPAQSNSAAADTFAEETWDKWRGCADELLECEDALRECRAR